MVDPIEPNLRRSQAYVDGLANEDLPKIAPENIRGVPVLVMEVASPGTEVKNRREKKSLYERFGVKEYIIFFPEREYVERYCELPCAKSTGRQVPRGNKLRQDRREFSLIKNLKSTDFHLNPGDHKGL